MQPSAVEQAVSIVIQGGVIAHATEGVWGFACDPWNETAVRRILKMKQRSVDQGLIVIGAHSTFFQPELDNLISETRRKVEASWPGHVTWIVPTKRFPYWITGRRETVAVRVPDHEQARMVSNLFSKPIVSTSVNCSGNAPAITLENVTKQWAATVDFVLAGEVGSANGPSKIFDAVTDAEIR